MEKDLFNKCHKFTRAKELMGVGLYPYFKPIEDTIGNTVNIEGKKRVMIGSNNYLGLTHHPRVIKAAKEALDKFGSGCTGSRFLNGNLILHEQLEEELKAYLNKEAVLVYSTGFQANLGSISCLMGKNDVIFSDGENHASIIDSCRISLSKTIKFPHNDMDRLEELLKENRDKFDGALIVVDGVFSMTGDIIDLPRLVELAKEFNCRVYCDDAHALGVLGPRGQGTAHHFDLNDDVDLVMATFSKSFASIGGYIAGDADIIHYIKHTSRSFIFSASMPPASVAAVLECVRIVQEEPEHLANLWNNVVKMREGLQSLGYSVGNSQTPVIPVMIGDDLKAFMMTKALYDHGVFATPVVSPGVPPGQALIRTSYMASHTDEELDYVLDVFDKLRSQFDPAMVKESLEESAHRTQSQPTV
jgi:8-amino-7-oxononanoate synthase